MAICEVCGNDYDRAFYLIQDGVEHVFDSLECAAQAIAPKCAHCDCRILGHGVETSGLIYCCEHCRRHGNKEENTRRASHQNM
jgi:hypothetical protein